MTADQNQRRHAVGIVDDHALFREGIASLINEFTDFEVSLHAGSGEELFLQLKKSQPPDLILLDVNMPDMDGIQVMEELNRFHPQIKVLAISMLNQEATVVQMLKAGAQGYLVKDAGSRELHRALRTIATGESYYSPIVANRLIHQALKNENGSAVPPGPQLNDRERDFLRLVCTELTYREIAEKMFLSARTIEGYRDNLFEKLGCKNRIGLVIFAIKEGLYRV